MEERLLTKSRDGICVRSHVNSGESRRLISKRTGIQVSMNSQGELDNLGFDIELAVFRIMQEALSNVHRHFVGNKEIEGRNTGSTR